MATLTDLPAETDALMGGHESPAVASEDDEKEQIEAPRASLFGERVVQGARRTGRERRDRSLLVGSCYYR